MVKFLKNYDLYSLSNDLYNRDVIIYGTSVGAIHLYKKLKQNNINVIAFTDSYVKDKEDRTFIGIPVITIKQLVDTAKDANIVIGTSVEKNMRQIISYLNSLGLFNLYADNCNYAAGEYEIEHMKQVIDSNKPKIDYVYQSLADTESKRIFLNLLYYRITNDNRLLELSFEKNHNQYFPKPSDNIMNFSGDEVFVDAGAYDGLTSFEFATQVGYKYKKIYAFEPDDLMYPIVKEVFKIKKLENTEVFQAGLYNKTTKIGFTEDPYTGSSSISETDSSTSIYAIALDELLYDKDVKITFVKMDIEGAEAEAIDGACKIIQRDKPKLAISIYHKEDDLWELPYKILTEYSGYKLFIRHYTDITTETVCYAIPINGGL
jgi:FkbM family methyltransferase